MRHQNDIKNVVRRSMTVIKWIKRRENINTGQCLPLVHQKVHQQRMLTEAIVLTENTIVDTVGSIEEFLSQFLQATVLKTEKANWLEVVDIFSEL